MNRQEMGETRSYAPVTERCFDIKEAEILKIPSACCNFRTQEELDKELVKGSNKDYVENVEKSKQFLTDNITSVRVTSIKEICDRYLC